MWDGAFLSFNPQSADLKYVYINHQGQFEIIINVFGIALFEYLSYGPYYKYLNFSNARIDFRRHFLMSKVDHRAEMVNL